MLPYWCARYADSGLYNTFISPAHLITKQSDDFLNATYVETLDTTLRDGAQSVDVSFTPKDKIRIAIALDELGVDYIEGGWPGSNPKDSLFFDEIKEHKLTNSKLTAFGSTMHKDKKASEDQNLNSIIDSGVGVATIFGKSWLLHVNNILKVNKQDNLDLVYDSVDYLRKHGLKVIFDAEHFYQGYLDNRDYAISVLKAAKDAGSDTLVLADTNGGTLPQDIYRITKEVVGSLGTRIGVHMHNDAGCAVANTLMGVEAGATHIQGTINGLGERSGNADIIQIVPSLRLKLGYNVLKQDSLQRLKSTSSLLYELSGLVPDPFQPFVGSNAFAHKGGIHSDAVLKDPRAYEHINPELVGNQRTVVISELSGASSLVGFAKNLGIDLDKSDSRVKTALSKIKELEKAGYSFDLAPESAFLVLARDLGMYKNCINMDYWKVISENGSNVAVVKTNGMLGVAEDSGPVGAIDKALRKALKKVYPEVDKVSLTDYRVVIPGEAKSTESTVRVAIELSDGKSSWRTMGVSTNIIEASIEGILDGMNYYLWKVKSSGTRHKHEKS